MKAKDSLVDMKAKDLPILEPLQLFDEDSSDMYFNLVMLDAKDIKTNDLFLFQLDREKIKSL